MDTNVLIKQRVEEYFVSGENNCAMTMLKILAEVFDEPLSPQVVEAAQVMPGAGGVGHLCGLVSGILMFIGVWGGRRGYHRSLLKPMSVKFTEEVQRQCGSIMCCDLKDNPRYSGCGDLAAQMLDFAIPLLRQEMARL
ncbi:MAG: C_GCAxxG_C_C family protein [Anaerolineae bacterium]|nr:C_GCAxxG_C_C family protein [Anaerolineae bacterium]